MKFTKGYGWIRILFDFNISKRRREPLGMLEPYMSPLYDLIESIQNEKDTIKNKRTLEQCLKQHSTGDEYWRSLWNSCLDKKNTSSIHIKEQWKLLGGKKGPSIHYNLWEQEAELGRLAQPPSYLTEVTGDSLNQCQLHGKWTSINSVHSQMPGNCWLLWFRVETFPSKTSDI